MMSKKISDYLRYISLEDAFEWSGDFTAAIVHDEFSKKAPRFGSEPDFRDRAIDRLINIKVEWHSEGNIGWNIYRRYVKIVCPYCNVDMVWSGSSGSTYICEKCQATAIPEMKIYFKPPRE